MRAISRTHSTSSWTGWPPNPCWGRFGRVKKRQFRRFGGILNVSWRVVPSAGPRFVRPGIGYLDKCMTTERKAIMEKTTDRAELVRLDAVSMDEDDETL